MRSNYALCERRLITAFGDKTLPQIWQHR